MKSTFIQITPSSSPPPPFSATFEQKISLISMSTRVPLALFVISQLRIPFCLIKIMMLLFAPKLSSFERVCNFEGEAKREGKKIKNYGDDYSTPTPPVHHTIMRDTFLLYLNLPLVDMATFHPRSSSSPRFLIVTHGEREREHMT
jgi:hypothetical protein